MRTLFVKYGGLETIAKIVSRFYDIVLENEILAPYFEDVDMPRLVTHQTHFFAMVMGAPANQYTGGALKEVHKNFKITDQAFDEVARSLLLTLSEFKVEQVDIDTIMNTVASTRPDIVTA